MLTRLADDAEQGKIPAMGTAQDMAKDRQGLTYARWSKESKPITYRESEWIGQHPYQRADELAAALNDAFPDAGPFAVDKSGSKAGNSAYVQTPFGSIRISDHGHNFGNSPDVWWSDVGNNAETMTPQKFVELYRDTVARSKQRAAQRASDEAAQTAAQREQNAPIVAEQEANRAAKLEFWRLNGLENATQTAKDKAWKAHKRTPEAKK
jgi:hypothetical protein